MQMPYCGLSLSEYLRKLGLGFVPRPALGDDFYQCYYRLCELCNRELELCKARTYCIVFF